MDLRSPLGKWKAIHATLSLCFFSQLRNVLSDTFAGQVKVGILHSQTGTMAISEQTVVNAELMAIAEINDAGGLLGMEIVPVIEDGASDVEVFAAKAENFTNPDSEQYVKVVFGCWTSASRKAVKPVFEQNNHMLFYPVQYEGQECSNNIFYTGATPNQQIEPAVDWLLRYKGKEFFLVGSDYVFPRSANEIIKGQLNALGGSAVGEMYLPLGESGNDTVGAIVTAIKETMPNGGVIFNTLNGDSNVRFFRMLWDAGLNAELYPSMSVSITETEIAAIGVKYLVGHYAAWNFFQSVMDHSGCAGGFDPTESRNFVENYRSLYGADSMVNDPMEAAYIAVKLWSQAVSLAGTFELEPVRAAVLGQAYSAPEGEVVMQANHHISKFVRIGEVDSTGDFSLVFESTKSFYPEPWSFWVGSTKGYACDWSNSSLGGFYQQDALPIALVHALTGPSAAVEKPFVEAEMAAIKTLNRNGGVLGKVILHTVYDTQSDDSVAMAILTEIAKNGTAAVIFGTPPSDKDYETAIAEATLATGSPLLFDPRRSLGGQCSGKVVHMGAVMNQQLEYALKYFSHRARTGGSTSLNIYLVVPKVLEEVGSIAVLTSYIAALGDVVVGSSVVEVETDATAAADDMLATMGEGGTVVNMLSNSSLTHALLTAMKAQSLAGAFPVVSTGVTEDDIDSLGSLLRNQYLAMPYFQAMDSTQNTILLGAMEGFYGSDYQVTANMEAAYSAVDYWAEAAEAAGSFASTLVLHQMWSSTFQAATGPVTLAGSNYMTQQSRLGTLNSQQTNFRIVSTASSTVYPDPYWLYPEADSVECDFMHSLRTVCESGKGLVDSSGTFLSNRTNSDKCDWCSAGLYSFPYTDNEGTTRICVACPAGQSQSNLGQTECEACEAGRYMKSTGAQECTLCPAGTYQNDEGSLSCQDCPEGHVTLFLGAESSAECVCQIGTYRPLNSEDCLPCPTGMTCPNANSTMAAMPEWASSRRLTDTDDGTTIYPYPQVLPGYVTPRDHLLEPYRCEPAEWCPGGPPGACSNNRDPSAVACARCRPGSYEDIDGICLECDGETPALYITLAIVVSIGLLALMAVVVNKNMLLAQHATITCGITLGLACTTIQAMGTFGNLSVEWVEPLSSMLSANSVLTFDIKVFRMGCFDSDAVTRYFVRQLFTPTASGAILVILYYKKLWFNPRLDYTMEAVNTIGALLKALFMSIVLATILPFICYSHPGNMGHSMLDSPAVLCYHSSDHVSMVIVGIVAFLSFVAPYFSLVGYATANYKRFVRESNRSHGRGLKMHRYLFFQFKPERYYYGCLYMLRGFLVCFVPVVIQDNAPVQIACMAGIFLLFFAIQQHLQPWKVQTGNYADGATSIFMIMILFCAAMSPGNHTLGVLASLVMCFLGMVLFGATAWGLFRRVKKKELFHTFITHHRGEAAAQARLLQLVVYEGSPIGWGKRCFLSADHTLSFDETLDIVRASVDQLVVLLTNSTLRTMVCAGEITIAHQMKRQIVPILTPTFSSPTILQLQNLERYLAMEDTSLAQLDITTTHVSEAYMWMLREPRLELDMDLCGRHRYQVLARQVEARQRGDRPSMIAALSAPASLDVRTNQIVISSDVTDNEATACAGILASRLPLVASGNGTCMLADYANSDLNTIRSILREAYGLVFVLTSGSLESDQMYQLNEASLGNCATRMVPVHTQTFTFPSKEELNRKLLRAFGSDHSQLEGCVAHLLKRPSVFISTGGSITTLSDQFAQVARQLAVLSSASLGQKSGSASPVIKLGDRSGDEDEEYDTPFHANTKRSGSRSGSGTPGSSNYAKSNEGGGRGGGGEGGGGGGVGGVGGGAVGDDEKRLLQAATSKKPDQPETADQAPVPLPHPLKTSEEQGHGHGHGHAHGHAHGHGTTHTESTRSSSQQIAPAAHSVGNFTVLDDDQMLWA